MEEPCKLYTCKNNNNFEINKFVKSYDQFSKFRSITMQSLSPRCTWKDEWSHASVHGNSVQGFDCNMQQTEILSVEISSTNIRLIKLYVEPFITVNHSLKKNSQNIQLYE